jgi:hypothetical protein
MRFVQRLEYVGDGAMTPRQIRKERRRVMQQFLDCIRDLPDWEERLEDQWQYFHDTRFRLAE